MMKKYKVILTGLGRIGWQSHLPAIMKHPGLELAAAVDPLPERCTECREQYPSVRTYSTLAEALQAEKPDITVIASPTCFHAEQVIQALRCGSHVFCDKPAAMNSAELKEMISAADSYKKILTVFQPERCSAEANFMQKLISSGRLGEIFQIRMCRYRYSRRNDWQAMRKNGGGMLLNYGSHMADLANSLFDNAPRLLCCTADRMISAGDGDDVVELLLRYGKVTVEISINQAAADSLYRLAVFGTRGSAVLPDKSSIWKVSAMTSEPDTGTAINPEFAAPGRKYPQNSGIFQKTEESMPEQDLPIDLYYNNLYNAVTEGTPLLNPLSETVKLVRLIDDAYQKSQEISG